MTMFFASESASLEQTTGCSGELASPAHARRSRISGRGEREATDA